MTFLFDQRDRLLRESWEADGLAQEIYAIFSGDVPSNTKGPVSLHGPITINNYTDGQPLFSFTGPDGAPVASVGLVNGLWQFKDGKGNIIVSPTGGGGSVVSVTLTGDVTGSGTTTIATTLKSVISAGSAGSSSQIPVITWDAKGRLTSVTTASGGGVSSVAMTVPGFLSVSGSPITASGTLAVTLATQSANKVFSGPTSGGAATPTFRSLVEADLPATAVFTDVANSFTVGPQSIQPDADAHTALTLKNHSATQSVNIFATLDSSNNTLFAINWNGRVGIGNTVDDTYGFTVKTGVNHERIRITGGISSGFYLTNPGNTDGATVRYDATDGFEIYVSNVLEAIQVVPTNALVGMGQAVQSISGTPVSQLHVWGNFSGNPVIVAQGASGQTGNLLSLRNNAGTELSAVLPAGDITTQSAGVGFRIKEGSNARMGTGTLSGGTVNIANTSVTANTRIFLTDTSAAGALTNVGSLAVTSQTAGTGFTVKSTNVLDASTFNWILFEPS